MTYFTGSLAKGHGVIPAKAGISVAFHMLPVTEIPAFAGMMSCIDRLPS
jgi:hypothetical protein